MLAHVDMDAFYASVEVLDDSSLQGKPVIVGQGERGVVSAASYEARKHGVRSAMPIFQAKKLCPQGIFLPGRHKRYREVSRLVMATLGRFTPIVEPVSVDEAFLDLSGTARLWGGPQETGLAIKTAIRNQTGLTCSVGIAPLRYLCKIASDREKPNGLTVVNDVQAFIKTIALKEVPGVGGRAQKRLQELGVSMLKDLNGLGKKKLVQIMGVHGHRLWEVAQGIDPSGVVPRRDIKSVSNERTLARDTGDQNRLAAHLLHLTEKVCRRLRGEGLCGRAVTLKLKRADFKLITRSAQLTTPSDRLEDIFPLARRLLAGNAGGASYRLIGVGVSCLLSPSEAQAGLFGDPCKERALASAEDEIARRFGDKALSRAGAMTIFDRGPKKKR